MTEVEFVEYDTIWESEPDLARWGYRQDRVVRDDAGQHWIGSVYVTTGDEGGIEVEDGPHPAESYEVTETKWRRQP